MERVFSNNLMGLVPIYQDNIGDCTKIFIENASPFILEKNIATVFNLILKYYTLDLSAIKSIYTKYITSKILIPVPFDKNNIFIPFKARKPKYLNDKSFGYFNLNYLLDIYYGQPIKIEFTDKQYLICISKEKSFKQHLKNGHIIKSCYENRLMNNRNHYYPKENSDINLLVKELNEIKNLIKP